MNTPAKDIMSTKLIVARDGMSLEDALKLLVNNKVTGLPVVDEKGTMVGIISEYDIIAQVGKNRTVEASQFKAPITFTREVATVNEDTPFLTILDQFIQLKIRRLPVIDKSKRLVGIISRRDVMKVLYYRAKVAG